MEQIECVTDFLNKNVEVRYVNDFTLYGILKAVDEHGIVLKTNQETSFISFSQIQMIKLDKRYYGGK